MQDYLGQRIIDGKLEYVYVITKKPDLKQDIDTYIIEHGKLELIPEEYRPQI